MWGEEICGECLGEWIEGHGETAYWPEFMNSNYPEALAHLKSGIICKALLLHSLPSP